MHDDPTVLHPLVAALRNAGHEVVTCDTSMLAWDALAEDRRVAALITRVRFPPGDPHGIALAHRARTNHPGVLVVFMAALEMKPHTEELGFFVPTPISPSAVAAAVDRMLSPRPRPGHVVEVMAGFATAHGESRREVETAARSGSGPGDFPASSPIST